MLLPPFVPMRVKRLLGELWYRLAVGRPEDFGLPKPAHHLDQAHPTISPDILTRLGSGDVIARPALTRREGKRVHFSDGTVEEVDAIIYATGYQVSFPFLDSTVAAAKDNDLPLFLRIFPFDREDLCFIGLAQPIGAVMPLAEAQSKLVAEMLSGSYELPGPQERKQRTERYRREMFAHYVPSRRHTMQLDFDQYMNELTAEAVTGRRRAGHRAARTPRLPSEPSEGRA